MLRLVTKQKEDLAVAAERAEQASKAKTIFLFNMSHDIRTPMNAILGFANLAELYRNEPEKLYDYLVKIRSSGNALLSILNNVLEMSRIEKGALALNEEACRIAAFYDAMYDMFRERMESKGIDFVRSMDIQPPPRILRPGEVAGGAS